MIVETTTLPFNDLDEAKDSLAGVAQVPGFILGYVTRLINSKGRGGAFKIVTVFDVGEGSSKLEATQREVLQTRIKALGPVEFRQGPSQSGPSDQKWYVLYNGHDYLGFDVYGCATSTRDVTKVTKFTQPEQAQWLKEHFAGVSGEYHVKEMPDE